MEISDKIRIWIKALEEAVDIDPDNGEYDDGEYRVTEKGRTWLKRILLIPYPEQVWAYRRDINGN
jgi:DNA-binding PadR family transcriptional regulator